MPHSQSPRLATPRIDRVLEMPSSSITAALRSRSWGSGHSVLPLEREASLTHMSEWLVSPEPVVMERISSLVRGAPLVPHGTCLLHLGQSPEIPAWHIGELLKTRFLRPEAS